MGCARKGAERSLVFVQYLCNLHTVYVYSSLKSMEHYHYVHNYYRTVKKQHYFIDCKMLTALLQNVNKWMVFAKIYFGRHVEFLIHSIFGIYGI